MRLFFIATTWAMTWFLLWPVAHAETPGPKQGCVLGLTQKEYTEVESQFQAEFKDLADQEKGVLKKMADDPAGYYFQLRTEARKVLASGKSDFPFKPLKPTIERIARDLKQRQTRRFGDKYKDRLVALEQKALELLKDGDPPYKASVRFIVNEYNSMLDTLFGERHPELMANEFHRHHAEHLLEKFLDKAPDVLMMFSFEGVDFNYFLQSRPAPFQLAGIDLRGLDDSADLPFADGFNMKPSEFTWHDLGHIDFMAFRDVAYIEGADKPIERIIWEWEATRRRIKHLHDQMREADPILGESIELVLSELLHERGFQYSLTVLKQELETPKWNRAILRKREKGFYSETPNFSKVVERLEEARKALLQAVNRVRDEDQVQWIGTLKGDVVPVYITYTPKLEYSVGTFERLELNGTGDVQLVARSNTGGAELRTGHREFLSVQINPTEKSPFTADAVAKIEALLWAKSQKNAGAMDSIFVNSGNQITVKNVDGTELPLAQVSMPSGVPDDIPRFQNLTIFELNQILGAAERKQILEFTERTPVQKFIGTIVKEQLMLTGLHRATIKTLDGKTIVLPLTELRIDPLTRGDVGG